MMLGGAGFRVSHLAIDTALVLVKALREYSARTVGVPALLTRVKMAIRNVVHALTAVRMRDKVIIVLRRAPVIRRLAHGSGTDAYTADSAAAVWG
jgi:methanogenic corrinoid protein MtbC1